MNRRATLASLRNAGRDPLAAFRADEALAIDGAWLSRVLDGAPLMFWDDDPEANDPENPSYVIDGSVAVYEVEGPITQRGWMCWQGYDSIALDLETALNDSRVSAVLLRINSPGGVCAGCFEGVRRMRASIEASGKRVVAFADEMAYSAAYAIACIADEIVLPEPGGVGSVGVIAGLSSVAKQLAAAGVDVRIITSGAEKADGHPALPLSPAAVARTQARVDELAGMFIGWVSERRKMSVEAVRGLEAGVRYGRAAVAAGLADRVASLPDVIARLQPAPTTNTGLRSAVAPRGQTAAAPAAKITTRKTMNEELAALIAAMTGKTDAAEQIGALSAIKAKAEQSDALSAKVTELERAVRERDLEDVIREGAAAGKLTPAMTARAQKAEGDRPEVPAGWARRQSPESLRAYLEVAPVVIPQGKVESPPLPPDARHADLAAKGWNALSDAEKHTLYHQNRPLFDRLKAAAPAPSAG